MKQRIENLSFEGVIVPLAEIELINCWVSVDNMAKTHHKVSSIRMVEGEEVFDNTLKKLCFYNGTAWETITSS